MDDVSLVAPRKQQIEGGNRDGANSWTANGARHEAGKERDYSPRAHGGLLRLDEIADVLGDGVGCRVEREVAAVNDVNFGVRHIVFVGVRLRWVER